MCQLKGRNSKLSLATGMLPARKAAADLLPLHRKQPPGKTPAPCQGHSCLPASGTSRGTEPIHLHLMSGEGGKKGKHRTSKESSEWLTTSTLPWKGGKNQTKTVLHRALCLLFFIYSQKSAAWGRNKMHLPGPGDSLLHFACLVCLNVICKSQHKGMQCAFPL